MSGNLPDAIKDAIGEDRGLSLVSLVDRLVATESRRAFDANFQVMCEKAASDLVFLPLWRLMGREPRARSSNHAIVDALLLIRPTAESEIWWETFSSDGRVQPRHVRDDGGVAKNLRKLNDPAADGLKFAIGAFRKRIFSVAVTDLCDVVSSGALPLEGTLRSDGKRGPISAAELTRRMWSFDRFGESLHVSGGQDGVIYAGVRLAFLAPETARKPHALLPPPAAATAVEVAPSSPSPDASAPVGLPLVPPKRGRRPSARKALVERMAEGFQANPDHVHATHEWLSKEYGASPSTVRRALLNMRANSEE